MKQSKSGQKNDPFTKILLEATKEQQGRRNAVDSSADYYTDAKKTKYSRLEYMVISDMHKNGVNYPECGVDDVKEYWRKRL
jgi:hypothetical protein